jgi:ribose 5-phosphate isomerase A
VHNPKEVAGRRAAELVEDGMTVGLGTGSTVQFTLVALGERIAAENLAVRGVPTSIDTEKKARELGVPLVSLDEVEHIDLTIDGADEIDGDFNMVKGGGGALLREKVVAAISKREAIVVGGDKIVKRLGTTFPLPVEAVPFAVGPVKRALVRLGCAPRLRERGGKPYVTDNGNHILDCTFKQGIADAPALERAIAMIPGAVASGLFIGLAHLLVIGSDDGSCDMREKHR